MASQRHIGGVKAKEEHIALLNGIPYILLKMIPGFDWALYRVQSESGIVFFLYRRNCSVYNEEVSAGGRNRSLTGRKENLL